METEFNCTKCGACCRIVPDYVLEAYKLPKAKSGGCGHLRSDNTCVIYDTRPDVCNVKTMWTNFHSKHSTWDEYKKLSEDACNMVIEIDNRRKQNVDQSN